MNKRKTTIDRPKLSSEEILATKNFGAVLSGITKIVKPVYKQPWFLSSVVVATAAVVTVVIMHNNGATNTENFAIAEKKPVSVSNTIAGKSDTLKNAPFIKPPIKAAVIPYSKYEVNSGVNNQITHKSGTKINIPPSAFVDSAGNPITGEVEIRYREFHDIGDLFLSGIPMTYDSAGHQYHFESAGMIDIKGFQNDKEVFIAPGKKLSVEMKSEDKRDKFNSYALDTVKKKWNYLGKNKIKKPDAGHSKTHPSDSVMSASAKAVNKIKQDFTPKIEKALTEIEGVRRDVASIEKSKPIAPVKTDAKKYHFNLDVKANEYPELALYKDVQFEVVDDRFKSSFYKITWDEAKLSKDSTELVYKLNLRKDKQHYSFKVKPTLEGTNYENAKSDFDKKFNQYTAALNKRQAEEVKKQMLLDSLRNEMKLAQERAMESASVSEKVFRLFEIQNFGIYNCDCPHNLPKEAVVDARFIDENGNAVNFSYQGLCLAERGVNKLYKYYNPTQNSILKDFRFNPKARNIIWGIASDGYLYMLKQEPGTYSYENNKELIIKLSKIDKSIKSSADLKQLFNS